MVIWNPFRNILEGDPSRSTGPGPWKEIRDKEFRKINSMSLEQLFHHIRHAGDDSITLITFYQMALYPRGKFYGLSGPDAAAELKNTMISILMKFKTRLDEELQIFEDIKNVREVMVGEISLSDHIALFCVHKHMVKMSKMVNVSRINRYQSRLSRFRSKLESGFEENRIRYLDFLQEIQRQQEMERVADRTEERRKRKRQAPERLNITTTKSKSYL